MAAKARFEITLRGRLALLLLHLAAGAAWLSGDDNARLAASMLAAPVLVDLIATLLGRPRLVVRAAPRRTVARAAFLETIRVRNEAHSGAVRELRLREPRTHVLDAGGGHLPWLGPGEGTTLRLAARSPRRGRIAQRTLVVTSVWPLGLFRWRLTLVSPTEMVTEPARAALPADVLRALAAAEQADLSGDRADAREFWSLREYRSGEDARHVHARRSAAVGTLVRQVHRGAADRTCAIVVDLRRPPGMPPTFGRRNLEVHLSRAATLVDLLHARGAPFRCIAIGDETERHDVDSAATARGFLGLLAGAKTVAYRALADGDLASIADVDACFWMAAGGYDAGVPRSRRNVRLVAGEAS